MDFTFLTLDQVYGKDALDVIKEYRDHAVATDLTFILMGNNWNLGEKRHKYSGDITRRYWTKTSSSRKEVICSDGDDRNDPNVNSSYCRPTAVRPALPPSETSKIDLSKAKFVDGSYIKYSNIDTCKTERTFKVNIIEYGEYPQTVLDEHANWRLEILFENKPKLFRPTGKHYTFDAINPDDYETPFKPISYEEYEIFGKRYIHIPEHPADTERPIEARVDISRSDWSNFYPELGLLEERNIHLAEKPTTGYKRPYWVEVEPIEWLLDKSGWMIAKKCLFSGIQFDTKREYEGDFDKTFMKHYLDTYFAKEIEPVERVAVRETTKDYEEKTNDMALKRAIVAPNVSKEKGVVNRKMSPEEKRRRLNATMLKLQNITNTIR